MSDTQTNLCIIFFVFLSMKDSSLYTLDYTISCYMGKDVSAEVRKKIHELPLEHHAPFFYLIKSGCDVDYSFENCGKYYDFIKESIVPVSYEMLLRISRMGKAAGQSGIKIRAMLYQELN